MLLVPVSLAMLGGLLALAATLERRSARVVVRLALRSTSATPELTERLVSAELGPLLAAAGLNQRPHRS